MIHEISRMVECCHTLIVEKLRYNVCVFFQAHDEHYIFSTFGVLHVHADKTSESMSLAAWQKESVLFAAARQIPFFKNYLVQKMFHRFRFMHFSFNAQLINETQWLFYFKILQWACHSCRCMSSVKSGSIDYVNYVCVFPYIELFCLISYITLTVML